MLRLLYLSIIPLIFFISCNVNDTPSVSASINLSVEDVSSSESWIRIKTSNINLPVDGIIQAESFSRYIKLFTSDSLIYVDSLLPTKSYNFEFTSGTIKSNKVLVQSTGPTNDNFLWQSKLFGDNGSSCLYDVAVINQNNIWAVGEIHLNDSTGQPDLQFYNAAKWNGEYWKLERIYFFNSKGQKFLAPIKTIFAFNENNIWLGGDQIINWDGQNYKSNEISSDIFFSYITRIWGTSSTDMYITGYNGALAHYNGNKWEKINSGTDLNLYDIYGDYNFTNKEYEILIIAAEKWVSGRHKILKLKNKTLTEVSDSNIPSGSFYSTWFKAGRKYYLTGDGIFSKNNTLDNDIWWKNIGVDLTNYYCYGTSGIAVNDLFICGSYGNIMHFNGINWKNFGSLPGFYDGEFYKISFKENVVAAVGYNGSRAFIEIGKR
jgi:hypothetical protein